MEILQSVLVYVTLAIAVGYVVKKFFLPKRLFVSKSLAQKSAGKTIAAVIKSLQSLL